MHLIFFIGIPIMVWALLSFLILFILRKEELLSVISVVMVSFLIVSMLDCWLISIGQNKKYVTYLLKDIKPIIAMQNNQTYIISRSSVNSSLRYYFMEKVDNEGYVSNNVPQNESIIYETNNKPTLLVYKTRCNNPILNWYLQDYYAKYRYEFYIPKGSIKQDFNIDLK